MTTYICTYTPDITRIQKHTYVHIYQLYFILFTWPYPGTIVLMPLDRTICNMQHGEGAEYLPTNISMTKYINIHMNQLILCTTKPRGKGHLKKSSSAIFHFLLLLSLSLTHLGITVYTKQLIIIKRYSCLTNQM